MRRDREICSLGHDSDKGLSAGEKTLVSFSRLPEHKRPQEVMQENDQRLRESASSLRSSFSWSLPCGEESALLRISDCDPLSHSEGRVAQPLLAVRFSLLSQIHALSAIENWGRHAWLCIERECNKTAQPRVAVLPKPALNRDFSADTSG